MKEKIWSFGVPFVLIVAGCFVAHLLYDVAKPKKANKPDESDGSEKAGK